MQSESIVVRIGSTEFGFTSSVPRIRCTSPSSSRFSNIHINLDTYMTHIHGPRMNLFKTQNILNCETEEVSISRSVTLNQLSRKRKNTLNYILSVCSA